MNHINIVHLSVTYNAFYISFAQNYVRIADKVIKTTATVREKESKTQTTSGSKFIELLICTKAS